MATPPRIRAAARAARRGDPGTLPLRLHPLINKNGHMPNRGKKSNDSRALHSVCGKVCWHANWTPHRMT